jgi:NAD(P)-dependent dehydrogenase (short-subunit alcohol dehydrogenase family)
MAKWTAADIPDQTGRTAVVTGANSGLGLHTSLELARRGARVVMACRDLGKGRAAQQRIRDEVPDADLDLRELDLADLASVRAFAEQLPGTRLDVLVNNAGVMALPRRETADGFEMHLGTNHLGHFALTGLLLDRLRAAPAARVVTVSSSAHRVGRIAFDDLQGRKRYFRWTAYGQSKLANLLFAFELQRRAASAGLELRSMAAHPGYAATHLQSQTSYALERLFMRLTNAVIAQSDAMGALPSLYAATAPDLPGGSFVGPDGLGEQRGHPRIVSPSGAAQDEVAARRLWDVSEELTGVAYAFTTRPTGARRRTSRSPRPRQPSR